MNLRFKAEFGSGGAQPMQLRIGAIDSVLHSWLIEWVQALRKEHPALELALTVETTPVLLDQMRRGTADLILAALPADGDSVRTRALLPSPWSLSARRSGTAAASSRCRISRNRTSC